MALDPDRIRFKGKAITAAIKSGGSIEHEEAASFFEVLHQEWKASGVGVSGSEAWLTERLKGEFKSLGEAPIWIDDEPTWPFLAGKPMVFLCQCSIPEHGALVSELSAGETVYLFGCRKTENGKTKMVYRTVSQLAKGFKHKLSALLLGTSQIQDSPNPAQVDHWTSDRPFFCLQNVARRTSRTAQQG